MPDLPKDGRSYRIWSVVEDLVLEHLDQVQDERMRSTYYLLREWLEQERNAGNITDDEFDYFVNNYEYYRDDFWPRLEKRHGIRRPQTKPPTIVIEDGNEYTEAHIDDAWVRARGFIFVEKSGMAEDLTPLSEHGWLIVAAQGESTRTFREKVANDNTDRPILVVTDADFYGGGITESLRGHSDRTEHLNLDVELESRVQEIGLTTSDARALDLPRERDPTQSPDEWRTELDSLAVLKDRLDLETPLLSYVAAKMGALDIPLCPLPILDPETTVSNSLQSALENAVDEALTGIVAEVMDDREPVEDVDQRGEGALMELMRASDYEGAAINLELIEDELREAAIEKFDALVWHRQSKYEDRVRQEIGAGDVAAVEAEL